jgi:hypothetical protein
MYNDRVALAPQVAFGALFTLLTSVLVFLDFRFGGTSHTSEQFSTAGVWLGASAPGPDDFCITAAAGGCQQP